MTQMAKGANIALTSTMIRSVLFWSGGDGVPDVDASALLLAANGKVASDDDFVFYNQPAHASGAVQHAGKSVDAQSYDVLDVHLAALPDSVERVALAASADGGTFGQVPNLRLVISDLTTGATLAEFPMAATDETAFVCGELYRRDGAWKFRAVGQGYASGLAGLATDFGIDVGGETELEPDAELVPDPAPSGPVLPPSSFAVPGGAAAPAPVPAPAPAAPEPAPEPAPATPPAPAAPPLDLTPQAPLDIAPPAPPIDIPPPLGPTDIPPPAPPLDIAPPMPPLPPPTVLPPAPPAPLDLPPSPAGGAEAPSAPAPTWAPPKAPVAPVAPVTSPEPDVAEAAPPAEPVAPTAPAEPAAVAAPIVPPPVAVPGQVLTLDACPISLDRNQRVSLASTAAGPLGRMVVNLGWVPGAGRLDIDLDASAIAFDASANKLEIVWYQHQNEFFGALYHTGDNKTGSAEGDGERILVDLARMPPQVEALVFTINSFHGQTFTDLERAQCTITDENGTLLLQYDLTDTQPSTAVLVAIVRRTPSGAWLLRTIGEYHDYRTVKKLVDPAARQVGLS